MKFVALILLLACNGCTFCIQNRAFVHPTWCWTKDAQMERYYRAQEKKSRQEHGEELAKQWGAGLLVKP